MSDKSVMIEIRGDIADINAKLAGLERQFKKNREAGERAYEGIGKKLSAMKTQIMQVVGVIYTLDKVWDAMNLAAKARQERVAFENLAASYGKSADSMIDELKRVSGETISTVNLIEKAGSAMMMGLRPDEIIKLMEIARATSRQTGQSISKAFEDIALGVARQSRKILDNLGIIVKQEQANEAYAESLNKTADQLNDAERRQAFMNATMKAGADLMERLGEQADTAADKLQRMAARFENFKVFMGDIGLRVMSLLEGLLKGISAVGLDLSSVIFSLIRDFAEMLNKIPGVNLDLFIEKYKKETAIARLAAEQLAKEARQAISDAFDFSEDKKSPANKLFFGGKTPEETGEELAKDLAKAVKKAQEEFEAGLTMPSPLDLALRRGSQPLVTEEAKEAAKLADQFTKEFEEAKESVSRLDEALMVSGATLSRLKAPVDSFTEHFKDKWHLMTDTARTDIEILADAAARAMSSMASGIGDAVARAVVYGEDLGESMKALLARVTADIISMLIEIQIQKVISHLVGKATFLSQTTAEALAGVSLAAINAFKSTAAIPIIGPALAPAAAAAAVAETTPFATTAIGAAATYGEGGVSWKRELAWVGEKGPEAHIPLKSGAVPVQITGGMASGHEIHIHAVDAASFTRLVENNPGAIVATVDKAIKRNARLRHTIRGFT